MPDAISDFGALSLLFMSSVCFLLGGSLSVWNLLNKFGDDAVGGDVSGPDGSFLGSILEACSVGGTLSSLSDSSNPLDEPELKGSSMSLPVDRPVRLEVVSLAKGSPNEFDLDSEIELESSAGLPCLLLVLFSNETFLIC